MTVMCGRGSVQFAVGVRHLIQIDPRIISMTAIRNAFAFADNIEVCFSKLMSGT